MLYITENQFSVFTCCRESRALNELILLYKLRCKKMIQIQGTSKLLSYAIERTPNKWKKKVESQ